MDLLALTVVQIIPCHIADAFFFQGITKRFGDQGRAIITGQFGSVIDPTLFLMLAIDRTLRNTKNSLSVIVISRQDSSGYNIAYS